MIIYKGPVVQAGSKERENKIMKIALMNEFSQSSKNPTILGELKKVVEPMGHTVYNTAMEAPLVPQDVPEAYTEDNPRLTYLHLGIQAALLLNSGAVDFVARAH